MKISTLRRAGMTLIEILVVIAIIAILATLLLGGVMAFMRKGPEAATKHDIGQLGMALGRFQADAKSYPPSRVRLCSNRASYGTTPLDLQSLQALNSVWPNIGKFTNMNWDGSGAANQDYTLEGDQCLVFFLGGIPNSAQPGLLGFSSNPTNPTAAGGDRKKYFDFDAGRLQIFNRTALPTFPFPSYLDAYRLKPIVYFSSGRRPDGYDPTPNSLGTSPYAQQTAPLLKYFNSTTFQLISAGLDGQFGPGSTTSMMPALVQTPMLPGNAIIGTGKDDITNFHDKLLGS